MEVLSVSYYGYIFDAGLMISGIVFFVMGIRKRREYAMPKEENDIWE
jgi:hypothetical protein